MKIAGLQKLTLLDFPGHIACTIFTPGCNFRCPFCHNSELVCGKDYQEYTEEEILDFLKTRIGKLNGIAVTGGEPLMQEGVAEFFEKVKALGFKIKLDTNGSYPGKLRDLIEKGLVDYIAMDVKNESLAWAKTVGLKEKAAEEIFKKTLESMSIIKNSGIDYEFRTTIVKELHNPEDAKKLGELLWGSKAYFIQSFKDSGEIMEDGYSAWDKNTLERMLEDIREYVPNAQLRGVD